MIVTVTLNPAIDKALEVPEFRVGSHAKATLKGQLPAGKGNNIARGLARLGSAVVACGFIGGDEEDLFQQSLGREGADIRFTPVGGPTRTNTTIIDPVNHTDTHLREEGFTATTSDCQRLRTDLNEVIERAGAGAFVVFGGSLPPGINTAEFVDVIEAVSGESRVMVDTSRGALRAAMKGGRVEAVKPNLEELGECLGRPVDSEFAPDAARELLDRVETVLLTAGAEGAYAVSKKNTVGAVCKLPPEEVRNTVGCGDAFLAGWLHGSEVSESVEEALRWGVATGAASARCEETVGYHREDVESLLSICEFL